MPDIVSEYVFLNHEEDVSEKTVEESPTVSTMNGDEGGDENGQTEQERPQPQNGAEAYENLVKSLTECDSDYMKDISDDVQMDENFGLIDSNILNTYGFTSDSGLFQ